VSFIR